MRRIQAHGVPIRGNRRSPRTARFVIGLACSAIVALTASPADAQDQGGPGVSQSAAESGSGSGFFQALRGRLSVHVNGSYQAASRRYETGGRFAAYGEEAAFVTRQEFAGGPHVDAGGTLRIWRGLAVGASYTDMSRSGAAVVTATVPHPLDFDRDRTAASAVSLPHRQRATHVHLSWRFGVWRNLDVTVFAGPTYYSVVQGVVTGLTAREAGGPTFQDVALRVDAGEGVLNGIGGNVGADVTWMVTDWLGVGYTVRASGGSIDAPPSSVTPDTYWAGGFQTGVGFRLRL